MHERPIFMDYSNIFIDFSWKKRLMFGIMKL